MNSLLSLYQIVANKSIKQKLTYREDLQPMAGYLGWRTIYVGNVETTLAVTTDTNLISFIRECQKKKKKKKKKKKN